MSFDIGLALAALSGVANGCFSLPMRRLGSWRWEQVWLAFMLAGCVFLPAAFTITTTPGLARVVSAFPTAYLAGAALVGFLWGFGAILFGRSINRLGVSLGNTLVLAISSCLGSLVPFFLSASRSEPHGASAAALVVPVAIQILGIVACGIAGIRRERAATGAAMTRANDSIVLALVMAVGSGLLSALFNVGFGLCHPLIDSGTASGLSVFQATNVVWAIILPSGAVPSLVLCSLMIRRARLTGLTLGPIDPGFLAWITLMGALWTASIVLYGGAVVFMGRYGDAVGWTLSLGVALLTANAAGVISGEWAGAPRSARPALVAGVGLLLLAIGLMSTVR